MEAIARRAGVNRTIVYRSFAGMPVLLATLLRREEARTRRTLDALLPDDPGDRSLSNVDAPAEAIDVDLLARMLLSTGEELGRMVLEDPDFPPSRVARGAWGVLDTVPVG